MGAESATDLSARTRLTVPLAIVGAALPVSGISAWYTDRACNHLEGDVEVAQPGTPRGSWCSAVEPGHHWWILLVAPVLAAFALVVILSLWCPERGRSVYVAVWTVLCALLVAQAVHVFSLRAYPEF